MSKFFLGIEVRSHTVSAVLVKNSFKETRVEDFEYVPLQDQYPGEERITAGIKAVIKKMALKGAACIASIPSSHISFRNIHIPFEDRKKIRQVLPFELEPSLPYPVDDLIIDFHSCRLSPPNGNAELLTAAVEKTTLSKYIHALSDSGIEPDLITINGYAAAQLISRQADNSKYQVFLDMDRQGATLFAVASDRIFLVRFFPHNTARVPAAKYISSNIRRTLTAFSDRFGFDFGPEEIYVSNHGYDDRDFNQNLEQILGVPVKQVDLRLHPVVTGNNQDLIMPPGIYDNALALAVSEIRGNSNINFLQGDFAPGKTWAVHKKNIIQTAVLAVGVCLAIFFNIFIDTYHMEKRLARINSRIEAIFQSTFPDVKRIVDPLQQMQVKMREIRSAPVLPGRDGKNILAIDTLYDLSRLISEDLDVNLTRLVVNSESIVISGDTDTFNSVDNMKNKLDKSKSFEKVTIHSADMDKGGKRVRFKMKIQL